MTANRTLAWALALARAGIWVFPCRYHDKAPATKNGFWDATIDEDQIRRWWETNPNWNIAIRCGEQPNVDLNLVALDIDAQSGGLESWALYLTDHEVPETVRHETPSGGFHLFFNTDREFRPGVNQLGPGIDVRGTDSYVVAPPSVTPSKVTGELNPYLGHRESFIGDRHHVAWMPDDMHEALLNGHGNSAAPAARSTTLRLLDTGDSVADKAREGWIWADELEADGWTYVRRRDGDSEWTRPGKSPRDGTSATLHGDGEGPLVVWSLSLPEGGLPTRTGPGRSYSPWDYIVTFRCGGDSKAAAALVRGATGANAGRAVQAPAPAEEQLYLPEDFWSATILLSEVRDQALRRLRTPDAVLAALLTMYATTIPMGIWLPGVVGAQAPLNLYAVVVGRSGGGKTSAMTIAAQLMGSPANADILLRKQLRSGEGLITLVNKPGRKGAKGEPDIPATTNVGVHVHYDEGGTLSKQSYQQAATTIPYLNTAWSGAGTVGGAKADGDAGFDASRVRICALIGVQYGIGANLFMGEAATLGFPQRLLFLSADDHPAIQEQEMPDEIIEPEPMGLPFLRHSDFVSHPTFVDIPRPIRQEVWDWSKQIPDPLDGHSMNLRLRIATVLMLLHGAGDSDFEPWWALSETVMKVHRDVRHSFVASIQRLVDEKDAAMGRSLGRRQEAQYEYQLDKGVESLLRKLGDETYPTRALKDHFKSWRNRYGFDHRDIIERARLLGLVVENSDGWRQA